MNKQSKYKTYHTFSGNDTVTWLNGEIHGGLVRINKKLDGDLKGIIEFEMIRFEKTILLPEDVLGVTVYMDENSNTSFEIFILNKLVSYENDMYLDGNHLIDKIAYKAILIQPMTPVSEQLKNMDDEVYNRLVRRVHAHPVNATWLPKNLGENNMAARVYYWVLDSLYIKKVDKNK